MNNFYYNEKMCLVKKLGPFNFFGSECNQRGATLKKKLDFIDPSGSLFHKCIIKLLTDDFVQLSA